MKKQILFFASDSDASSIYMRQDKTVFFSQTEQIKEEQVPYQQIDLDRLIKQYRVSLSKKRLLKTWEKNRKQVQIAPHLPEIIEHLIYKNVYEELSPQLADCYHEDYHLPYLEITLQSWIQQCKLSAQKLHRDWDVLYWEEISQFIQKCSSIQLLSDLNPH